MAKRTFDSFSGVRGHYDSPLDLVLEGQAHNKEVRKFLTLKNKSVEWQLRRFKDQLSKWNEKQSQMDNLGVNKECQAYIKAVARIEELEKNVNELEPRKIEYLYSEAGDDLIVPPGFWWLCSEIVHNSHLNSELRPYFMEGLRPYQQEALAELYKYNRATLELFTGAGKTRIVASICLAAVQSKKRCMIVVPTEYLVGQTYDFVKALHPNTSALGGGRQPELGWDILITTINSALQWAAETDVLVYDEGHHLSAATWMELATAAEKATHVYSLTATAFRSDGLDLMIHAFTGPVVYARDARWGIENKWLSPYKVFQARLAPKHVTGPMAGKPVSLKDQVLATKAYQILVEKPDVFQFIMDKMLIGLERGRRVMVIFRYVQTAKAFRAFCKNFVDIDVAHAGNKASKAPLKKFREGKINVLVGTDKLISEGIDLPDASLLIMATNHTSDVTTFQMSGRVLRVAPDKKDAICIDVAVSGYSQFERAADRRLALFKEITNDVQVLEMEKK